MATKKSVNKTALNIIKEIKQFCSLLFGDKLRDVYLYGSYARGDFDKYSDVDVLITLDMNDMQILKYRKNISEMDCDLTWKYDIMVNTVMVPLQRFNRFAEDLPFYRNVINEGINYGLN